MTATTLKESRVPYGARLDHPPRPGEVTFLEENGQPVAAVVSMDEFAAFLRWREAEAERERRRVETAAIEQEARAFQEMLPDLLQKYPGRVVAICKGQVIGVGDQRMEVWQAARQAAAGAPVYIQDVQPVPAVYKMPSRRVKRDVEV